jgi:hypothetical protein
MDRRDRIPADAPQFLRQQKRCITREAGIHEQANTLHGSVPADEVDFDSVGLGQGVESSSAHAIKCDE